MTSEPTGKAKNIIVLEDTISVPSRPTTTSSAGRTEYESPDVQQDLGSRAIRHHGHDIEEGSPRRRSYHGRVAHSRSVPHSRNGMMEQAPRQVDNETTGSDKEDDKEGETPKDNTVTLSKRNFLWLCIAGFLSIWLAPLIHNLWTARYEIREYQVPFEKNGIFPLGGSIGTMKKLWKHYQNGKNVLLKISCDDNVQVTLPLTASSGATYGSISKPTTSSDKTRYTIYSIYNSVIIQWICDADTCELNNSPCNWEDLPFVVWET